MRTGDVVLTKCRHVDSVDKPVTTYSSALVKTKYVFLLCAICVNVSRIKVYSTKLSSAENNGHPARTSHRLQNHHHHHPN